MLLKNWSFFFRRYVSYFALLLCFFCLFPPSLFSENIKILSGTAHPKLAEKIAQTLNGQLVDINIKSFQDQETDISILDNISHQKIYVIQSTCTPSNQHLMELFLLLDALKRSAVNDITVCIPYYGYARQDRQPQYGTPISAKLVANLLKKAGAKRIVTFDLHAPQIEGFFDIPIYHLSILPLFTQDIQTRFAKDLRSNQCMIISPDAGGVKRASKVAKSLNCHFAVIDKKRDAPGSIEQMQILGNLTGKKCIIIDDMADSSGTLCRAAQTLIDSGALEVHAYCTHGVLSGKAPERIDQSQLTSLTLSNTIPIPLYKQKNKIRVLSVHNDLAHIIQKIHNRSS